MSSPRATAPASLRVAVVGAGVAGLACAGALARAGADVTVFDKGRGVGGRLATRRVARHAFDLGAQYFTVRDPRFAAETEAWIAAGACAPWPGRVVAIDGPGDMVRDVTPARRLVGVPDGAGPARHLARGLTVRSGHRVDLLARAGGALTLRGTVAPAGVTLPPTLPTSPTLPMSPASERVELGAFDRVVLCMPPSQVTPLVTEVSPPVARAVGAVELEPCLAVGFVAEDGDADALRALGFDGAFVGRAGQPARSPLGWVARDAAKPGRPAGERWILHATGEASSARPEGSEPEVTAWLLDAFVALFGLRSLHPTLTCTRRWALARARAAHGPGVLFDEASGVGAGGDWSLDGRVEGAFLAGLSLAERVLSSG